MSSPGVLGFKSTRVARSMFASAHMLFICWISCSVQFEWKVMAVKRYPSFAALSIISWVCLAS